MLGKLLKHEFRATARLYLPLFGLAIVLTPILAFITHLFDFNSKTPLAIISGFSLFGYIVMMIGVLVASFVLVIIRFYRSMTKDSAYLTFTIPVKVSSIVLSKLIVAFVWQALSVIIIGLSIAGFTYSYGIWDFSMLGNILKKISSLLSIAGDNQAQIIAIVILYLIAMIIGTLTGTLQIYASIAFGQTARKHRILISFACYLGFYTLTQIVSSIILIPFMFMSNTDVKELSYSISHMIGLQLGIISISLAFSIILGVVYFIITNAMFKKHLNLE